jgi:hypothetical protein
MKEPCVVLVLFGHQFANAIQLAVQGCRQISGSAGIAWLRGGRRPCPPRKCGVLPLVPRVAIRRGEESDAAAALTASSYSVFMQFPELVAPRASRAAAYLSGSRKVEFASCDRNCDTPPSACDHLRSHARRHQCRLSAPAWRRSQYDPPAMPTILDRSVATARFRYQSSQEYRA